MFQICFWSVPSILRGFVPQGVGHCAKLLTELGVPTHAGGEEGRHTGTEGGRSLGKLPGCIFSAGKGMDFGKSPLGASSRAWWHGRSRKGLGSLCSPGFHPCFPQLLQEPGGVAAGALQVWGIQGKHPFPMGITPRCLHLRPCQLWARERPWLCASMDGFGWMGLDSVPSHFPMEAGLVAVAVEAGRE